MGENKNYNFRPIDVECYTFYSEQDAQLAKSERQKVDYLMDKLDFSNPESIYKIYEKAISDRVFRTPVGIAFLKETRDYLIENPEIDSSTVSAIPLPFNFETEVRKEPAPVKRKVQPPRAKDSIRQRFRFSVILNMILIIMVIAMFVITVKSDQPNILNYERAILNRYAGWQQELTEREQQIRLKERELNINGEIKDSDRR